MRSEYPEWLERGRQRGGFFRSDTGERQGRFVIDGPCGRRLLIMASDGADWSQCGLPGVQWEHVSVSIPHRNRCPNWEEMCFVKNLFWDEEETVIQFHPPRSQYVNVMPFCLHLWKPVGVEIPLPPRETLA